MRRAIPLVLIVLSTACATNPVTGQREFTLMTEAQEISLGKDADAQIRAEMGVYDDPALQQYVSEIGMRMAKASERPTLPWQFTVVDQPAINAFALPGGYIYITRGILPFLQDEAELAGVLGHEIGHVTARHSVRQYTRSLAGQVGLAGLGLFVPQARPFGRISETVLGLMFLRYGRNDELQSDQLGARYAAATGWDPTGVPGMLSTLGRLDEAAGERRGVPNWLSTHPEPLARVNEIQPAVQQLKAGRTNLTTNRDALVQRVDGLIFGDNPAQGVVRDGVFLHPPLRLRIQFPASWDVMNTPQQVMAKAPNANVFMLLQLVDKPQGTTPQQVAVASMQGAGFRIVQIERFPVNGLDAVLGVYEGQIPQLGPVTIRAAHILHDGRYYFVAGIAPPADFRGIDATVVTSLQTFRAISAAEAEAIRPDRVDVYVVRQGDTWASIAERSNGAIKPAALAVMNGADPGSTPPAGARIKIVVRG